MTLNDDKQESEDDEKEIDEVKKLLKMIHLKKVPKKKIIKRMATKRMVIKRMIMKRMMMKRMERDESKPYSKAFITTPSLSHSLWVQAFHLSIDDRLTTNVTFKNKKTLICRLEDLVTMANR